jgi:2-dehydropantoate 2-reductase
MDAVHIIGAGGIGCAVGFALRQAGVAVTFIDADPDKVLWGRCHGVGVDGRSVQAEFIDFAAWRPSPDALHVLCTKCYDNAAILKRLPPDVPLLPIQNGFDAQLRARVEAEGIASFISECVPGRSETRITRRGRLHLGPVRGSEAAIVAVRKLAGWLRQAPLGVVITDDILPYKYAKLMYNAAISPLAAAAGLDNGELLRRPLFRRLFFALLQENYAILRSAGVRLGKVGPFHPSTVAAILRRPLVARVFAWAFYPGLRGTYCSMFADLPRGRTEIDNYNGHLIELAGEAPCPLNRRAYALVKRMEQEGIAPNPEIVSELLADSSAMVMNG